MKGHRGRGHQENLSQVSPENNEKTFAFTACFRNGVLMTLSNLAYITNSYCFIAFTMKKNIEMTPEDFDDVTNIMKKISDRIEITRKIMLLIIRSKILTISRIIIIELL